MPTPSALRHCALQVCVDKHLHGAELARLRQGLALDRNIPNVFTNGRLTGATITLSAALCSLGLLMWLAANWDEIPPAMRFALLQGLVFATSAGAWRLPRWRAPLGLLALVATGGLFAFFGMTYQTGADTWQLFALWATLTLPLALGVRSDVVWAPWALVAMVAVSLWSYSHVGHNWWPQPGRLWPHVAQQVLAGWVVLAMSGALARVTGVGLWGRRTALVLWLVMLLPSASSALWVKDSGALYGMAAAVTAGLAWGLSRPGKADVFGLSAVMLGVNVLLFSGTLRVFDGGSSRGAWIATALFLTLVMAAALAATARWVVSVARHPLNSKESE